MTERRILGGVDIGRSVTRIAHEIVEKSGGCADLVLVGLQTRGVPLAHRLARNIRRFMEADDARIAWVTDLSELHHVGAVQRRMFFDDNRKVEHRLQARMMCIGVCAPRPLQRGLVTAFSWFIPTPFPMRVFGELDEALGWARTQLAHAMSPR